MGIDHRKSFHIQISSLAVLAAVFLSAAVSAEATAAIPPEVTAKAFALYDSTADTFLLGADQDRKLSPASITKVLTVLLALENLEMSDTITITREMYQTIPNDYVRLGLMEGEIITVEQAIYGCMLNSCNDAAMAIALTLSDSVEDFSVMMNERAAELGCSDTNFTNPYGLADPAHLTTAHDMALIMAQALKHDKFIEVALTKYYSLESTNLVGTPRGMPNGNKLIPKAAYAYEHFIGGKTGYTDLSGNTLVSGARKDGRTLVVVILGAPLTNSRYEETRRLFDYGFSEYEIITPELSDFDVVRNAVLNDLGLMILQKGFSLEISGSDVVLDGPFATEKGSKTSGADGFFAGGPVLEPDPSNQSQTVEYPLFFRAVDNTGIRVGTLNVLLEPVPPEEGSFDNDTESGRKLPDRLFGILASILAAALIVGSCVFLIFPALIRRKHKHGRHSNRR